MKTFKEHINEGNAMDYLKPKSKEEIEKGLEGLSDKEIADSIFKNNLPEKYLPKQYVNLKKDTIKDIRSILNRLFNVVYNEDNKDYINFNEDFNDEFFLDYTIIPNYEDAENFEIVKLNKKYVNLIAYWEHDNMNVEDIDYEHINTLDLIELKKTLNFYYKDKISKYDVNPNTLNITDIKYDDINEGNAMDYLKPKSQDDIKQIIKSLDIEEQIKKIKQYNLPSKWLPSNEEISKILDEMKTIDKIKYIGDYNLPSELFPSDEELFNYIKTMNSDEQIRLIIQYNISYKFLARNKEGICVSNRALLCNNNNITKLPENLKVLGNFACNNNELVELPKGLYVDGHFLCHNNKLVELPNDLHITGMIFCYGNNKVLEKPENAFIGGKFKNT